MASFAFDDLAFAAPPAVTRTGNSAAAELFCPDCNEVPERTTADRKRCLTCGCELENRRSTVTEPSASLASLLSATGDNAPDFESLIAQLLATMGEGMGMDMANGARRPATERAVQNLGSFTADQASTVEVAVVVSGIKGEVVAVPANFGPCESIPRVEVVVVDPVDGATPLANAQAVKGNIAVMKRGVCTFAQKIRRAQDAGAVAVIIIQTQDVWPYSMTDSKGESAGITIPAFMLSQPQGTRFLEYLQTKSSPDDRVEAEVTARKDARECVICQVDMSIGTTVTRMPCQHMFHTACLYQWLKIGNSCPICRVEIPSQNGSATTSQGATDSADQSLAWSSWFS